MVSADQHKGALKGSCQTEPTSYQIRLLTIIQRHGRAVARNTWNEPHKEGTHEETFMCGEIPKQMDCDAVFRNRAAPVALEK